MKPLTYGDLIDIGTFACPKWMQEASTLGLKPGDFPGQIPVDGIGNGEPFIRTGITKGEEGELVGVTYQQHLGIVRLLIIND